MSSAVPWGSRGVGLDLTPGCFVCGCAWRDPQARDLPNEYMHNVAALLAKDDEPLALACFDRGARMGYYHADPQCPQIKVGACTFHLPELQRLSDQWFISRRHVGQLVGDGLWRLERALEESRVGVGDDHE